MFNTKRKSFYILMNFLTKINQKEWEYYINKYKENSVIDFLINNIVSPKNVKKNIIIKYIHQIKKSLNINFKINISFISENIFWEDIFTIDNTIFINYNYYQRKYDKLLSQDNHNYIKVNNKFFNKEFMTLLLKSIYYIYNFYNSQTYLNKYIENNNCYFIYKNDLKNLNEISYFNNPNFNFLKDKIPIYYFNNKTYINLDIFISKPSFSPYYENKFFQIIKNDNLYKIII